MLITSRALQECDKWMINRRLVGTNQHVHKAKLDKEGVSDILLDRARIASPHEVQLSIAGRRELKFLDHRQGVERHTQLAHARRAGGADHLRYSKQFASPSSR
jgi:hypothetical protein